MNAQSLEGDWDVVIVHDPQPAGMRQNAARASRRWIWRCHIDLSTPNPETLARMRAADRPAMTRASGTVSEYVPAGLNGGVVRICPPAIDPLSPKNMALSPEDAAFVCEQFGIDTDRPLICQVSRFDPWKDPIGVIDAYRMVKERVPDAQLALVGSMATDDPEGWEFFHQTFRHADGDPDIKILNNLNNVGAIEVNAFQSQADVCMQKSTREGFGLTVTEAQWKGRPMIGGDVGGIPLQITDGVSGFLVSSPEEAAQRTVEILEDPELAKRIGRAGKEHAREHFLTPRLLRDWLQPVHRARDLKRQGSRAAYRGGPTSLGAWTTSGSSSSPTAARRSSSASGGGERAVRRGGGGLVTALTGLVAHRGALWVASAMTDEDVAVAREADGEPVAVELDGVSYDVLLGRERARSPTTASTT